MLSQLFPNARQLFLTSGLNWTSGNMRAVLLADAYVPTFTEANLSDIPANVRVATSVLISGRTATGGVAGCSAIDLGVVISSIICSKAVVYRDTGSEATSTLILFVGDEGFTTTPFAPLGFQYYIYPNAAFGGLFRL